MRKIIAGVVAGAFILSACGTPQTGGASQPTAAALTAQPAVTAPATTAPAPTAAPATAAPATALATLTPAAVPSAEAPGPGAGGASVRPPDELVKAVQQRLAAYLKRPAAQIELQSANAREWPDGSLGCPAEGMAYPQVVTPGFLLIFTSDNQAQRYEVHTGASANQALLCANGTPSSLAAGAGGEPRPAEPAALDEGGQAMLAQARAALARELGIAEEQVRLASAEPIEWNDSSLGCPQPGSMALQVITPGYRFVLEAGGQSYEYHTDTGKRVVRCEGPAVGK